MNRIFIIGNLTADPSFSTASGTAVCHFNVAENYYSNGDNKVNYYRVTAFRGLAESCNKYLAKGRRVGIIGKIQQRDYTDNNGNTTRSMDVLVDEVQFLSSASEEKKDASQIKPITTLERVDNSDLPF